MIKKHGNTNSERGGTVNTITQINYTANNPYTTLYKISNIGIVSAYITGVDGNNCTVSIYKNTESKIYKSVELPTVPTGQNLNNIVLSLLA